MCLVDLLAFLDQKAANSVEVVAEFVAYWHSKDYHLCHYSEIKNQITLKIIFWRKRWIKDLL